jgi:hypothetical protein
MPSILTLQGPQLTCLNCGIQPLSAPSALAGIMDTMKANTTLVFATGFVGFLVGALTLRALARTGHAEAWGIQRIDQARARQLLGHGRSKPRKRRR